MSVQLDEWSFKMLMTELQPLLERQLTRCKATADAVPSQQTWQALLERISQTYAQADQDRYLSERSLSISNQEMRAEISERKRAEAALQRAHSELEQQVAARTADLRQVNSELRDQMVRREQAERTLTEERNLLRTLIDTLPDYVYIKDADCRFVNANLRTALGMGAATPQDLIGKTDLDYYPPEAA